MLQISNPCNEYTEKQKYRELSKHFWKNDEKMSDSKFIYNHFRKVPRASEHQKTSCDLGPSGKKPKFRQKPVIPSSFGTHFSHFRHADACVALREASRLTLNDS